MGDGDGTLSWDEWLALDLGPPNWLIPGLLEKGGAGLLHGGTRSFKSFFLLRLCLDLASAKPIMDIWPMEKPYRTFMLQAEGSKRAWRGRMVALRESYPTDIPFWSRHTMSVKLDQPDGREMMAEVLRLVRPDLVVVDPIANFFQGSENDGENMQRWLDTVNLWREACGCAVILCHHDRQPIRAWTTGKTIDGGMDEARGSTRLPAWADFVGGMRRKDNATVLKVQKIREGEDGQEFHFELREGKLVLTDRSDAIELCVMAALEDGRELWVTAITQQVFEETGYSRSTIRRAVKTLKDKGDLVEVMYGARIKIKRNEQGGKG